MLYLDNFMVIKQTQGTFLAWHELIPFHFILLKKLLDDQLRITVYVKVLDSYLDSHLKGQDQ